MRTDADATRGQGGGDGVAVEEDLAEQKSYGRLCGDELWVLKGRDAGLVITEARGLREAYGAFGVGASGLTFEAHQSLGNWGAV